MRFARRALVPALTLLVLCAAVSAQTLRPADDPRNTAPTVGTGGGPGGPTGLFTIYDGQTLRKGEFTFSVAYSNYDRDPGNVDIVETPLSFQIGLSDYLELFFNNDGYRGIKVNNPLNLSSFRLPNVQMFVAQQLPTGAFGPVRLQSGAAVVLAPVNAFGITGALFRPVGNQPFVQFPFVGGSAGNFTSGFPTAVIPGRPFTLGAPTGGAGNFGAAANFPGIGSVFGSILPGVVLTTGITPATATTSAQVVPVTFTVAPTYLPDAPFISRLYGESSFNTFTFGAKWRFTDPDNPLGVGVIPFYRWYWDKADDQQGFNQLQRGSSPGGNWGDFGAVLFVDGRLSKRVNLSANLGYILNSNPKGQFGNVEATMLDRPDELLAGLGFDFPVNEHFQLIAEAKSVQYVGGRTPNAFENDPFDVLGGIRIFPGRWWGMSAWYRAHINQQGNRLFNNDGNFPRGFIQSEDPHGFGFQLFAGRRNERAPTELPNNPPTVNLTASQTSVTLAAQCPEGQRPVADCTPTSAQVQLSSNATDPDGDTLLYTWSTTGGRIVGDGPNVSWDLSGVQAGTYTASVEVDDGCGCIAYSSTSVTVTACGCEAIPTPTPTPTPDITPTPTPPPTPTPTQFDTYGVLPRNDEKARLDNFAIALQNDPTAQGYIITYGGRRGRAGEAATRGDFARNYLVNTRGIDPGRIVTIDGGFKEEATTELWIVPSGATPPTAQPTVSAEEVQIIRGRPPRRGGTRRPRRR